jgi:hypothetical protein
MLYATQVSYAEASASLGEALLGGAKKNIRDSCCRFHELGQD